MSISIQVAIPILLMFGAMNRFKILRFVIVSIYNFWRIAYRYMTG